MRVAVVGAGVTGLAVAMASRAPVFERADAPGGICRSYYLGPDGDGPHDRAPVGEEAFRFETGGGHWIFGGDPGVLELLGALCPFDRYERRASVRLGGLGITVPYPLQRHLELLGPELAARVGSELAGRADPAEPPPTLAGWLDRSFGPTLCDLFFLPFHDRYTAGLTATVAPQDDDKSPAVASGAPPGPIGYNAAFGYPRGGLDVLLAAMAGGCDVRYGKRLVGVDRSARVLQFGDGTEKGYDTLVSTLPLSEMVTLAGLELASGPDPHTSVLVLNIGAVRGPRCPGSHWEYEADSGAGFHRIGYYSNVDPSFLPRSERAGGRLVSLYVERAYPAGKPPTPGEVAGYASAVTAELQGRGTIGETLVVDPSWVDVAYTWRVPGSRWRDEALRALAGSGIRQVGRYGRWQFQGIAESVAEGWALGLELRAR